jgi:hypothetical protein
MILRRLLRLGSPTQYSGTMGVNYAWELCCLLLLLHCSSALFCNYGCLRDGYRNLQFHYLSLFWCCRTEGGVYLLTRLTLFYFCWVDTWVCSLGGATGGRPLFIHHVPVPFLPSFYLSLHSPSLLLVMGGVRLFLLLTGDLGLSPLRNLFW